MNETLFQGSVPELRRFDSGRDEFPNLPVYLTSANGFRKQPLVVRRRSLAHPFLSRMNSPNSGRRWRPQGGCRLECWLARRRCSRLFRHRAAIGLQRDIWPDGDIEAVGSSADQFLMDRFDAASPILPLGSGCGDEVAQVLVTLIPGLVLEEIITAWILAGDLLPCRVLF